LNLFSPWSMSVTSRRSVETVEQIELGIREEASFDIFSIIFENSSISKTLGYFWLWDCVQKSGFRKFRNCTSTVGTWCQLSSIKVNAQCDKLATVVGGSKLTTLAILSHWASTSGCSTITWSYQWHFFHRFHRLATLIIHHLLIRSF